MWIFFLGIMKHTKAFAIAFDKTCNILLRAFDRFRYDSTPATLKNIPSLNKIWKHCRRRARFFILILFSFAYFNVQARSIMR